MKHQHGRFHNHHELVVSWSEEHWIQEELLRQSHGYTRHWKHDVKQILRTAPDFHEEVMVE